MTELEQQILVKTPKPKPFTAGDMLNLLTVRYAAPAYAFLSQVRNQTGFSKSIVRTADGLALSLYPSRGIHLHGFEIKVSRGDWLSELRNPVKADEIGKHCHYWWIVAPSTQIVPIDELPATWGLLIERGGKLFTAKEATFMNPEQLPLTMMGAIFRKATESMIPGDVFQTRLQEALAQRQLNIAPDLVRREKLVAEKEDLYRKFEDESGLNINEWNLGDVAAAVRVIKDNKIDGYIDRLKYAKENFERMSKLIGESIESVENLDSSS
jgi:hypothetical protein